MRPSIAELLVSGLLALALAACGPKGTNGSVSTAAAGPAASPSTTTDSRGMIGTATRSRAGGASAASSVGLRAAAFFLGFG